ncbi:translocation and assembly module TamB [Rhodoblastus acidophilus]|uniref:translocation/assembly module TamB domain-containing protein n=1 Tax=Rhodoblastus acidophilus TaxID=1074 RepID=UPI002224ECB3|nr:translocation/assembly module TamB domain-containing protein [Rhodoblastus acidophilus]MCW2286214.1 translocation and assembly module TamB [Rhodoblastus acidophilus]MCW2335104.1 translocation and assembly module TamB [Rhodoblastus acidophilus]
MKHWRRILLALALVLVASGLGLYGALLHYAGPRAPLTAGEDQKGLLASVIENTLSSPDMQIQIEAVDGALTSDATIRGVTLSDKQGPWLKLDQARLVWTRSALLTGRLLVDRLEVGRLELLRPPVGETKKSEPSSFADWLNFQLPVTVVLRDFSFAQFDLGEPVIGVAARLSGSGHATLGSLGDALDLGFDARRQDAAGALALRLNYDPRAKQVFAAFSAHEPAGGLIAHAADLDGLPPVDFDLNGAGPVDQFDAKVLFKAGPLATIQGEARMEPRAGARALRLDVRGALEKILPPWIAPVFSGETALSGAFVVADDGAKSVEHLQIAAREAVLDLDGRLAADEALEGRLRLQSRGDDGVARAGGVEIGALELRLDAAGALKAPKLDFNLHVAEAALPEARLKRLDAHLTTLPNGLVTDPATRVDLKADASGEGLHVSDPALARALGQAFSLTLRGRAAPNGATDISLAEFKSGKDSLSAKGLFGPRAVKGRVDLDLADLQRFAALAKTELRGAFKGQVELSGDPAARLDARLALRSDGLASGFELLDGLIGGKTEIRGGLSKLASGFAFSDLTLAGRQISARIDGAADDDKADVTFKIEAPDLSQAAKDLAGRVAAQGRLTGSLAHPDLVAAVDVENLRSMGHAVARLKLDLEGRDLIAAPSARVKLAGEAEGKPASGLAEFSRGTDGVSRIVARDIRFGSLALNGAGALDTAQRLEGDVDVVAGNLDDLSVFLRERLAGRLSAKITLRAEGGQQDAAVKLDASGLRFGAHALALLAVDARAQNLFGAPRVEGTATLDRAEILGESIPRLRLTSRASADGSEFALVTEARGIALEARGKLAAGAPVKLDLNAFEARRGAQRISLAGPASFGFPSGGVTIGGLALKAGAGRLDLSGSAGEKLDLTVAARALPLDIARMFAPDAPVSGALDFSARVTGSASAPEGAWRAEVKKLTAPQMRAAGVASAELRANGVLQGRRTSLDLRVELPRGGNLTVQGQAPLSADGSLDLALRGALDAALANTMLADGGQRVAGRLTLDARAQGSAARPALSGTVTLANGLFEDPLSGVKVEAVNAVLRGRGEEIVVERFNARAGDGNVDISGVVRLGDGFPANLRIGGRNARLAANDIVTLVADLGLDVSGPLARHPRIGGKVTFSTIDVRVPDRLPSASRPLDNTSHVQPTAAARARIALDAKKPRRKAKGPAFNADLDVAVSAPSRIFIHGRGMDAELGGNIRVVGSLERPVAQGAFELRRGLISLAGKQLQFTRGNIVFNGDVIPDLDFAATSSVGDITAQLTVSGPAEQPRFAFSSTPDLPQDEVLSRLLFNTASSSLSPIQALQLAQTVAMLSGQGGDAVDKMRRALGVDSLDVQFSPDGSPRVGSSRYILPNVSVGVRTGTKPEDSAATVSVDVTKRLRVQGEAGADGSTSAGVGAQWEY